MDEKFVSVSFSKFKSTNCMHNYENDAIILVYVDDLFIFAKTQLVLDKVKALIGSLLKLKNLVSLI